MFKPFQQFDCKKSGGISFGMKPMCDTCKTTETTMWRKGADGEVLCNSCGLNSGKVADDSNDISSSNYGTGKGVNGVGSQFVGRVRKSARLKPSKYKLQSTTKALATKGKNRRVIFKKNVRITISIGYRHSVWVPFIDRVPNDRPFHKCNTFGVDCYCTNVIVYM